MFDSGPFQKMGLQDQLIRQGSPYIKVFVSNSLSVNLVTFFDELINLRLFVRKQCSQSLQVQDDSWSPTNSQKTKYIQFRVI